VEKRASRHLVSPDKVLSTSGINCRTNSFSYKAAVIIFLAGQLTEKNCPYEVFAIRGVVPHVHILQEQYVQSDEGVKPEAVKGRFETVPLIGIISLILIASYFFILGPSPCIRRASCTGFAPQKHQQQSMLGSGGRPGGEEKLGVSGGAKTRGICR
jgi:hypothetical protein